MGVLDGLLARIGALPNPGNLVAQGAGKVLDPSYPVDAGLARWIAGAPAFQPTLGGMLTKTATNLVEPSSDFLQKILAGDFEGASQSSMFPMGGITTVKGFDKWRAGIWDDVKAGKYHPDEVAPSSADVIAGKAKRLYRAMSDREFEAAQKSGVFKPIRPGDPDLYVTADPDRLAGGAYGARGGGRIVEFDPVPVHKATGRLIDVDEVAAKEIPFDKVKRVWEWDESARDHVLKYERPTSKASGLRSIKAGEKVPSLDEVLAKAGHAKTGGQFGVNGDWYKGGQFLPSSERTVKGALKVPKGQKAGGKAEIAPGVWAARPADAARPIKSQYEWDWSAFRESGQLKPFANWDVYSKRPEVLESAKALAEEFNKGARWVLPDGSLSQ